MSSNRNQSIIEIITFSKESKYNNFIVLSHGFLYIFSFSVIIFKVKKERETLYWGILMMMAPLGTLFNVLKFNINFYNLKNDN